MDLAQHPVLLMLTAVIALFVLAFGVLLGLSLRIRHPKRMATLVMLAGWGVTWIPLLWPTITTNTLTTPIEAQDLLVVGVGLTIWTIGFWRGGFLPLIEGRPKMP